MFSLQPERSSRGEVGGLLSMQVDPGEMKEEDAIRRHIKDQNVKKAEAARAR